MRRCAGLLLCAVLLAAAPAACIADEGMWPIEMLDKLPWTELKAMGLQLQPRDIYDGKGHGIAHAIVSLGGTTGFFVSPNGLILTNHHVAFSAIQRASTPEHNYLDEGFFAARLEDEIQARGVRASVLAGVEDVTKKVLSVVTEGMGDLDRYNAIERRIKELVAEAEEGGAVECRIAPFYNGLQYKLFTFFVCRDVRIVHAPPASIGKYGGDIDNWMWPRHTGDFTFLRAYVSPGGAAADYAPENVPYKPAVYLPISARGIREGDFTMIIGFPGKTDRFTTSHGIKHLQDYYYPTRIEMFRNWIGILQDEAKRGPDVAIKNATWDSRLNNSMKNYEGMLAGLKKENLLQKKTDTEKSFATWLAMDAEKGKKYGNVLRDIAAVYERQSAYRERSMVMGLMSSGCQMLGAASTLEHWSEEKTKPDLDRDPGYQERDLSRVRQRLGMLQMTYDPPTDRRVLRYFLVLAAALPPGQRIATVDAVIGAASRDEAGAKIDAWLDRLYSETKLGQPQERMRLFDVPRDELLGTEDPFIDFAAALNAEKRALEDEEHAVAGAFQRLYSRYLEALMAWKGGVIYPDANGTMRLTYGTVQGYRPRDAVQYRYITSLEGVVEKNTGEEPFDCPLRLVELSEAMDFGPYEDQTIGDVPVNFLSTCDITGGNSGSPILNGRGECIGTAFDGNYESISSDYLFIKETARSINVDARYILFILDKMDGAKRLLDEMKIR